MLILLRDRIHASPEPASARARWAWSTLGGLAGSFGLLVVVVVAAGLIKLVQQELETSAARVDAGPAVAGLGFAKTARAFAATPSHMS
jgi:hypothetical protein